MITIPDKEDFLKLKAEIQSLHEKLDKMLKLLGQRIDNGGYYTIAEVRRMFNTNNDTLKRWHVTGKLKQIYPGGEGSRKIFYRVEDVNNLLK